MKNIHILPTDKASRLHLDKNNYLSYDLGFYSKENRSFGSYQHIYITSDEVIKEGDWCLDINKNIIILWSHPHTTTTPFFKKIILTTDADLIADGVQAIDDEFLQWFVKNPSCEYVEVVKEMYIPQLNGKISDGKITHELSLNPSDNTLPFYKIIIPKEEVFEMYSHLYGKTVTMDDRFETKHIWSEELSLKNKGRWIPREKPKQKQKEHLIEIMRGDEELGLYDEPQETLEKASLQYRLSTNNKMGIEQVAFESGAKWQAERMYSKEEVLEILCKSHNAENTSIVANAIMKWFEQFKKK